MPLPSISKSLHSIRNAMNSQTSRKSFEIDSESEILSHRSLNTFSRCSSGMTTTSPSSQLNFPRLRYKILVLGPKGGGKSALVHRFAHGNFLPSAHQQHANIEKTEILNHPVTTDFWCPATSYVDLDITTLMPDSPNFENERAKYVSEADGIILVFSIVEKDSLKLLEENKRYINDHVNANKVGVTLCGTNSDAKEKDTMVGVINRLIKLSSACQWCYDWGPRWGLEYAQVNSTDGVNTTQPFNNVIAEIRRKRFMADTQVSVPDKFEPAKGGKNRSKFPFCCKN